MSYNVSEDEEQALILYPSRQKVLLLFVGALVLVVAGAFILPRSSNPWNVGFDILVIVFFGLCALVTIFMLVKPSPLLNVNDEGFHQWSFFGNYLISWEEIAFIFLSTARLSSSLNVYLSEAGLETFSARYPWRGRFCRLFGNLVTAIPFITSPISAQQIFDTIQEKYQKQIEQYNIYVR